MLVPYCRGGRHCRNLAEGGCLLSRFHFTRCRYFLGHVACRNLPGQGLIIHLFSTQAICFPSCSLRCCQVSLLQQRYYIGCSYPKVALLHHSPRTPSSTCSYHFSFLSSWCNSHNFQCIILATLSCRLLYSFRANFLHSLTRWHTLSPFSPHILHLTVT